MKSKFEVLAREVKASTFVEESGRFALVGFPCCLDTILGDGCPCCDTENNSIIWCDNYDESKGITEAFKETGFVAVELWDKELQKHCILVNEPIDGDLFHKGGK